MEKKIKTIFINYKQVIIPLILIVGCFLILFFVILPQVPSISGKLSTIKKQNGIVSDLKNSISTVNSESSQTLDSEVSTSTTALPTVKDISVIFDALTRAAESSNTTLSTFSLNVGGVYGTAARIPNNTPGTPNVNVIAHVQSSDSRGLVDFATALSKTLPLSEVKKINVSGGEGTYDIDFYFKPVDSAKIAKQDHVAPLTASDKSLLNQLEQIEK